jgi:hypothetical protein
VNEIANNVINAKIVLFFLPKENHLEVNQTDLFSLKNGL